MTNFSKVRDFIAQKKEANQTESLKSQIHEVEGWLKDESGFNEKLKEAFCRASSPDAIQFYIELSQVALKDEFDKYSAQQLLSNDFPVQLCPLYFEVIDDQFEEVFETIIVKLFDSGLDDHHEKALVVGLSRLNERTREVPRFNLLPLLVANYSVYREKFSKFLRFLDEEAVEGAFNKATEADTLMFSYLANTRVLLKMLLEKLPDDRKIEVFKRRALIGSGSRTILESIYRSAGNDDINELLDLIPDGSTYDLLSDKNENSVPLLLSLAAADSRAPFGLVVSLLRQLDAEHFKAALKLTDAQNNTLLHYIVNDDEKTEQVLGLITEKGLDDDTVFERFAMQNTRNHSALGEAVGSASFSLLHDKLASRFDSELSHLDEGNNQSLIHLAVRVKDCAKSILPKLNAASHEGYFRPDDDGNNPLHEAFNVDRRFSSAETLQARADNATELVAYLAGSGDWQGKNMCDLK